MLVMSSYNSPYADMKYLWNIKEGGGSNQQLSPYDPNPKRAPTLTLTLSLAGI